MNRRDAELEQILDQALNEIREETPDPQFVAEATEQVWEQLATHDSTEEAHGPRRIESCAGFQELIPAYYDRYAAGTPSRWVETMRRAMASSLWQFSTTRMLQEYTERLYLPAAGVETPIAVVQPVATEAG